MGTPYHPFSTPWKIQVLVPAISLDVSYFFQLKITHARILQTNAGAGTFKTAGLPLDWLSAQRDHSREFSNLPSDE